MKYAKITSPLPSWDPVWHDMARAGCVLSVLPPEQSRRGLSTHKIICRTCLDAVLTAYRDSPGSAPYINLVDGTAEVVWEDE